MTAFESAVVRWRKLPIGLRYGLETFVVRLAVGVALAFLAMRILDLTGYLPSLRENTGIPRVNIKLISLTSFELYDHLLTIDQMIFVVVLTLVAAAAFAPWRSSALVLGLVGSTVLLIAFPYTRLSRNFLRSLPGVGGLLPEGFELEKREPEIDLLLAVLAAMTVAVLFAGAEGTRLLRRAYEEKGVALSDLRSLGTLQAAALGLLALAAMVTVLVLYALRAGLDGLIAGASMPRVNPVVAFLVMGFFLATAIIAFAWKPEPGSASSRPKLALPARKPKE